MAVIELEILHFRAYQLMIHAGPCEPRPPITSNYESGELLQG